MADALKETETKNNKFHDLYYEYDAKIKTLQQKIKKIKEDHAGDPLTIEVELKKLSRYTYNNIPLDQVYNDLLVKQNYIYSALTSPYIKTRGHKLGETLTMLSQQLPSVGLYGLINNQKLLDNNPLTQTDAEDRSYFSVGYWDYLKRTFFPHIAPRFSNSDGNGLYKVNEYYDGGFEKKLLKDQNPWYKPWKDQNVDAWGRDSDHEFFGIAPESIVDSASDETILNTLNGDNVGKNTVVTPPPVGDATGGGKPTEVINTNIKKKKGSGNNQVTNDTSYKGAVAASTTIDDSESENTISKRVQLMSKSIQDNPSRIQEGLMEDPRWSSDRLAKLRIKDQDFQKAKGSKDLMIAFNKDKASGVYS